MHPFVRNCQQEWFTSRSTTRRQTMKRALALICIALLTGCAGTGGKAGGGAWVEVDPDEPLPHVASTATFADGRAYASVLSLSEEFGNIYTAFVDSDLERLGISRGDYFTFGRDDKTFRVLLGKTYSDVPRGQWVAFFEDDASLKVARNLENAAATAGCAAGDTVFIAPIPD
jgi:hypothetical protein